MVIINYEASHYVVFSSHSSFHHPRGLFNITRPVHINATKDRVRLTFAFPRFHSLEDVAFLCLRFRLYVYDFVRKISDVRVRVRMTIEMESMLFIIKVLIN